MNSLSLPWYSVYKAKTPIKLETTANEQENSDKNTHVFIYKCKNHFMK